jgi:uncharacterized protein (TIGR02611 family)
MTRSEAPKVKTGAATGGADPVRRRSVRQRVRSWPGGRLTWRIGVTIAGAAVIVAGVILLPLPGPGWLIIFGGLGILATEYMWAARLLQRMRSLVRGWTDWAARQPLWVRLVIGVVGLVVVGGIVLAGWYLTT